MYKIFLIEDDEKLQEHIKEYLERYDYQVETVEDYKKVEEQFYSINPDLVLLDINLPYYDGFYFCRILRRKNTIPIIIISARTAEAEQVMGIELGADDYITKPLSLQILLAKIKACFRRSCGEYVKNNNISINGLTLDESNYKIIYENKELEFSKNECKLIKKLIEDKDKVVTREKLLEILWDDTVFVDDNTLTVNVTRVKNKLRDVGIENAIKTKRGVGYFIDSKSIK
ncbi:response regulator transcription factor [Clostridium sp. KNHs214]|uniref:response regulator transcription factor n=1 Tax=Clostridium sp. KNHs214 TaxID=1540257 RepID=UPI000555D09D|nr:response regulator transcription factor [Clostridium sp. KNHs214]